ncbi:MAG: hypothetical protein HY014_07710 [Acidobacteria bacterium]|nr:hypothetical protein [Acidobacteriota bacterium]MBI3488038.1 hypothetical protein [Acidobacteriota bacterium]
MPPWNHIHPAIVHFPIALLTVAPLLVLLGLLWPAQRRGILSAALLLLLLGGAGLLLALESGEAVERYAHGSPELIAGLRQHERLAQRAMLVFGLLDAAFLVLWALPLLRRRELSPRLQRGLLVLWLAGSAAGVLTLGLAGHAGGHLVHDLHTHEGPEPPPD